MGECYTKTPSKLGFGLMRLPRDEKGNIDVEETSRMVDAFLAAGLTYFDTAYVYEGSEEAIRKALVERHPRNTYTLTDKLNVNAAKNEEEAKKQIQVSLERTGAGFFDYYLLHAISEDNAGRYEKFRIWDYMHELLQKGLIRHYGFSFHGKPELLDRLLSEHPDVAFVQLQINYADWESPTVQARRNWEVCRKYGKQVVVMEPVKGGTLANPLGNPVGGLQRGHHDGALRHEQPLPDAGQPLLYGTLCAYDRKREGDRGAGAEGACRHQKHPLHGLPLLHRRMSEEDFDPGHLLSDEHVPRLRRSCKGKAELCLEHP